LIFGEQTIQEEAMPDLKPRVGFIGIGAMGTPMSQNIEKAGFPLTVYDRLPERTAEFAARGVPVASCCVEVARKSDIVMTMIGQVAEELEVVLGASGALEGAHPGLIVIDSSIVGIVASKKMAAAAREKGVGFLDATVSGPVGPAKEAKPGLWWAEIATCSTRPRMSPGTATWTMPA
jgi:3-hydroxyisobutyrate dehydrogenase-like beta-hydroxyacid dehydrogenase